MKIASLVFLLIAIFSRQSNGQNQRKQLNLELSSTTWQPKIHNGGISGAGTDDANHYEFQTYGDYSGKLSKVLGENREEFRYDISSEGQRTALIITITQREKQKLIFHPEVSIPENSRAFSEDLNSWPYVKWLVLTDQNNPNH